MMGKLLWTCACVAALAFPATGQDGVPLPSERVILNDLLAEIAKPEIATHVRILERMGKFNLLPAQSPTSPAEFAAFHRTLAGAILFIPASGRPFQHNQVPSPEEVENPTLRLNLARGQRSFAILGVVSRDELTGATLAVGPLTNAAGQAFPADAIQLHLLKQVMRTSDQYVFRPSPFALQPLAAPIRLRPGITHDFVVEATAAESTPAGTYSGTVTFTAGTLTLTKQISLTVRDFALLRPGSDRMNWGFYCALKNTGLDDYRFMASWGINTVVVYAGIGDEYLERIKVIRESGIDGILLLDVGALDTRVGAVVPYSDEWATLYKEQVALFHRQMQDADEDGRYIGLIHDEPRETMLNPWNRTYEQTMIYHRLVGEAAPTMPRGVNPMTDGPVSEAHPLGLYAEFAKTFEMIMPHYWAPCQNMIRLAKDNPACRLWSYNDGDNRLAWGLHSWKVGLKGRTLYHYRPYGPGEHPLSPVYMSSREFDGRSFTGNYVVAWPDQIWGTAMLIDMHEGINDYRHVHTLEHWIAQAPADRRDLAAQAQTYLDTLRNDIPEYAHAEAFTDGRETGSGEVNAAIVGQLDAIRAKLADYIEKLAR